MNTMKKATDAEAFDHVLLSYAEMCYAVALALTHDRDDAYDLAKEVLIETWNLREKANAVKRIKYTLLVALRKKFMEEYRKDTCSFRNEQELAERN